MILEVHLEYNSDWGSNRRGDRSVYHHLAAEEQGAQIKRQFRKPEFPRGEAGLVRWQAPDGAKLFCIYNQTREKFVATDARIADGYFSRLVGLLGTTARWAQPGKGLWIVPSHGVHTIGMLYSLDLVFLDRNLVVVDVEEHVRPFRVSKVSFKTTSILELPVHTVYRTDTRAGDQLEISPVCSREPAILS